MTGRLGFAVGYFAFWMVYQAVQRVIFLLYHHAEAARVGAGTVAGIMIHGARMDLAVAAIPCLLVFPLLAVSAFAPRVSARVITAASIAIIAIEALLTAVDAELFRAWGFRLDGAVLQYFHTPGPMVAASRSSPVALLTGIFVVLALAAVAAFLSLFGPPLRSWQRLPLPTALATIPISALLVATLYVPLHGGIQKQPIKQSTVYFSSDAFANQAALDVTWNFLDGVWHRSYRTTNPYQYLPEADATRVVDSLYAPPDGPPVRLLRIARPNVIIILWESLTSKVIDRLGGVKGVTPNFDSLTHQGVFFDHMYATGFRSPRGLVGVLSGYPSQPTTEIIKEPRKSASLPALAHDFDAAGYATRFYYGGDLAFGNFRSFLMAGGFDSLISDADFHRHVHHTDWGEDDEVVFGRLASDLPAIRRPFFLTLFTMSSHEPFVVPMPPRFPGNDEQARFLNAHAYTDRTIGNFIRAAKTQPWWDSTLIVLIADHGHRLPVLDPRQAQHQWEIYAIPMLWIGGALAVHDTVITQLGSQTDVPATLLPQLGLDASKYAWSRDLLAPGTRPWAWFSFTDGFGFVNDSGGAVAWDNVGRRIIGERAPTGPADIRDGKALLQRLIDDYVKR